MMGKEELRIKSPNHIMVGDPMNLEAYGDDPPKLAQVIVDCDLPPEFCGILTLSEKMSNGISFQTIHMEFAAEDVLKGNAEKRNDDSQMFKVIDLFAGSDSCRLSIDGRSIELDVGANYQCGAGKFYFHESDGKKILDRLVIEVDVPDISFDKMFNLSKYLFDPTVSDRTDPRKGQNAGLPNKAIKVRDTGFCEMDKEVFWRLIADARENCGRYMKSTAAYIKEQLQSMPPEQVLKYHGILMAYKELAYKYGLWTAAGIYMKTGCSDDGFIDFRAWLIAQGKESYLAALKNPDDLVKIRRYGDCRFEEFNYIAYDVYNEQTGRNAYDDISGGMLAGIKRELVKDIQYSPMIEYPLELPDAVIVYPKICRYITKEDISIAKRNPQWNPTIKELKELLVKGQNETKVIRQKRKKQREKGYSDR